MRAKKPTTRNANNPMKEKIFSALILIALLVVTGCHTRTHWSKHFNEQGSLVHEDKTRAVSFLGKSESAKLNGTYDYMSQVNDQTNLAHKVTFLTEAEKKAVDSEGVKATGEAAGGVIGAAARAAATGN